MEVAGPAQKLHFERFCLCAPCLCTRAQITNQNESIHPAANPIKGKVPINNAGKKGGEGGGGALGNVPLAAKFAIPLIHNHPVSIINDACNNQPWSPDLLTKVLERVLRHCKTCAADLSLLQ